MAETQPDLAAYERYWMPRRRRLADWLAGVWRALRGLVPGRRDDRPDRPNRPPFELSLVPRGGPRTPSLSGAAALEEPDDAWDGDVTAYPKEL